MDMAGAGVNDEQRILVREGVASHEVVQDALEARCRDAPAGLKENQVLHVVMT